jgi:hypothetical protein
MSEDEPEADAIDRLVPDAMRDFVHRLLEAESVLKIEPGTLIDVQRFEDWAFLIALSALLETAATGLLQRWIGVPALNDKLRKMNYGIKLEWLKLLGLPPDACRTAVALAKLRNDVAHDIDSLTSFKFDAYLAVTAQRDALKRDLGLQAEPFDRKHESGSTTADYYLAKAPKMVVMYVAASLLETLALFDWHRRELQREARTFDWLAHHDAELAAIDREALLRNLDRDTDHPGASDDERP